MKLHKLFLTALLMLIPMGAFAQDGVYKTIDFTKPSNPAARKILFYHELKRDETMYGKNNDLYKETEALGESVYIAYKIDLNDDGINEIVGLDTHAKPYGKTEGVLPILKRCGNYYKDISHIIVPYNSKIYVLNTKTNGWRDLLLEFKENNRIEKRKIKNTGNGYTYLFEWEK